MYIYICVLYVHCKGCEDIYSFATDVRHSASRTRWGKYCLKIEVNIEGENSQKIKGRKNTKEPFSFIAMPMFSSRCSVSFVLHKCIFLVPILPFALCSFPHCSFTSEFSVSRPMRCRL